MAQMKDKKQQLDEWFEEHGDAIILGYGFGVVSRISVKELYKMFKLGIELGYEPEDKD